MGDKEERIVNVNVLLRKLVDFFNAVEPLVKDSGDEDLQEMFEIADRSLNVLNSLFYCWPTVPRCNKYPEIPLLLRCTRVHPAIPEDNCDWTHPRIPLPEGE